MSRPRSTSRAGPSSRNAGIQQQLGSVAPPTTSGGPLTGADQIELGTITIRQLGKHIGDKVRAGSGQTARKLTITGTVTLPSIGVTLEDHPSLGVGALIPEKTLLATEGLKHGSENSQLAQNLPAEPTTAVFDVTSARAGSALATKITAHSPDGTPGGTYRLWPLRGAAVINASQMGSQPLALALALTAAAVLALALTVLASVRQRWMELALLKSLGLRPRQVRVIIAWQTTSILAIAAAAGIPLGITGGRWAWEAFADSTLPDVRADRHVMSTGQFPRPGGDLLTLGRIAPLVQDRRPTRSAIS